MPRPALSLVAFYEEEKAIEYLQKLCVLDDSSPQALLQHFQCAKSKLEPVIANPGNPQFLEIPPEYQPYCQAALNSPAANALAAKGSISVQLVEIAPLLASQHHIELERAASLYTPPIGKAPEIGDMLPICLPLGSQLVPFDPSEPQSPNSWMIRTPSFNLRIAGGGLFSTANGEVYFGAKMDLANPFVWVAQYQGMAYVGNGYHRGYSLGKAGAKFMPCIVQQVQSSNDIVQINFPIELLHSEQPPTLAHYIHGQAYPIQLRNYRRYLQVTYAEHLFYED